MRPIEYRDALTNELLLKRYQNQFDLVRFVIHRAQDIVHAGREQPQSVEIPDNLAYYLLAQVATGTESASDELDASEMPGQADELDAEQIEGFSGDAGSD